MRSRLANRAKAFILNIRTTPPHCDLQYIVYRFQGSPLLLAHRAEERRPSILRDPLDGAPASLRNTGFALAVIDAEMVLEIARLAVGLAVIAQRRAARLDGSMEHRLDGVDQHHRP